MELFGVMRLFPLRNGAAGNLPEFLPGSELRLPSAFSLDPRVEATEENSFSKELRLAVKEARVGEVGSNLFSLPPALPSKPSKPSKLSKPPRPLRPSRQSRQPVQVPVSRLRSAGGILRNYKVRISFSN